MAKDRGPKLYDMVGEEASLAPSDLYATDFKKAVFRGYDKEDVDGFLHHVADVYDRTLNELREAERENAQLREEISALRDMESTLRSTLVSSQKFEENIVESARREADALIEQGRAEKARAEADARLIETRLSEEVQALMHQRNNLRQDLLSILTSHHEMATAIPQAEEGLALTESKPPAEAAPEQAEPVEEEAAFEELAAEGEAADEEVEEAPRAVRAPKPHSWLEDPPEYGEEIQE